MRRMPVAVGAVVVALASPQLADLWSPQPGWQVVQDHAADPDLLVIGLFGEAHVAFSGPPSTPPTRSKRVRGDTADMPRLALRCENGVSELQLWRAPRHPALMRRSRRLGPARATTAVGDGKLVLDFGDGDPIDIELRDYPHRAEPILLPDPFDTIGRLRRHQQLHYFEIDVGERVYLDFQHGVGAARPDAVFQLAGLDELLRVTRDPCGWRSSHAD